LKSFYSRLKHTNNPTVVAVLAFADTLFQTARVATEKEYETNDVLAVKSHK